LFFSTIFFILTASFSISANTPFKPLFPAPNNLVQAPSTGSPLLFQHKANNISTLNPLLQPLSSSSQLPSSLIQPSIRPPSIPSAFQSPPSAFTPLHPSKTHHSSSSLIQPKLTIGNQSAPLVSPFQPIQFPLPQISATQGIGITSIIPPPSQDVPIVQHSSQFIPSPPLPTDLNPSLPPPPQQITSGKLIFSIGN
jgi:hypothetical protein